MEAQRKKRYAKGQTTFAYERTKKLNQIKLIDPKKVGISPRNIRTVRELLRQIELTSANGCNIRVETLMGSMGGVSRSTVERARKIAVDAGLLFYHAHKSEAGGWRLTWQVIYRGVKEAEAQTANELEPDEIYHVDNMIKPEKEPCVVTTHPCVITTGPPPVMTGPPPVMTGPPPVMTDPIESLREPKENLEKETPNGVCDEQAPSPPSEFRFPTKGKGPNSWDLPQKNLDEYLEAYPDFDVRNEIRKARQWCQSNHARRKTASGMLRFLTAWLNRTQNNPRRDEDPLGNHALRNRILAEMQNDKNQS